MRNKKYIYITIIIVILIISICIGYIFFNKNTINNNINEENNLEEKFSEILDDGTKINTSSKLNEPKEIDGIVITNIKLTENSGITKLTADIINKTSEVKKGQTYKISFINDKEEEMATMKTYIKDLIANETTKLNASIIFDYTNAYNFKITKE